MQSLLKNHLLIAVHLVFFAIALTVSALVAHHEKAAAATTLMETIKKEHTHMSKLAEITDRNEADAVTATIVADCERRTEFESLINTLGTLGNRDLLVVQQLFESCGSFYSERKALMVAKLEREFEILETNVHLLETLGMQSEGTNLDAWEKLIALERDRSASLRDLTQIQSDIITTLIKGEKSSGMALTDLTKDAQALGESLSVQDKQIDSIRATLTP